MKKITAAQAQDYMCEPFMLTDLRARITALEAALQRTEAAVLDLSQQLERAEAALTASQADAERLAETATPYVSPVQTADYGRQLRQHEALVAALSAHRALVAAQKDTGQ